MIKPQPPPTRAWPSGEGSPLSSEHPPHCPPLVAPAPISRPPGRPPPQLSWPLLSQNCCSADLPPPRLCPAPCQAQASRQGECPAQDRGGWGPFGSFRQDRLEEGRNRKMNRRKALGLAVACGGTGCQGQRKTETRPWAQGWNSAGKADGGGTGWLWCCGMGEPWENSEQEN